jgi:hypothetical protein
MNKKLLDKIFKAYDKVKETGISKDAKVYGTIRIKK